jgi:hypothetical protein
LWNLLEKWWVGVVFLWLLSGKKCGKCGLWDVLNRTSKFSAQPQQERQRQSRSPSGMTSKKGKCNDKSNGNCEGEMAGDALVVGGGLAAYFEGADEKEDGDGQEGDPAYEAEAVHEG